MKLWIWNVININQTIRLVIDRMEHINENKQCLQTILNHITALVCLMEYEDIKSMEKLVNMSISLSAQISAMDEN